MCSSQRCAQVKSSSLIRACHCPSKYCNNCLVYFNGRTFGDICYEVNIPVLVLPIYVVNKPSSVNPVIFDHLNLDRCFFSSKYRPDTDRNKVWFIDSEASAKQIMVKPLTWDQRKIFKIFKSWNNYEEPPASPNKSQIS